MRVCACVRVCMGMLVCMCLCAQLFVRVHVFVCVHVSVNVGVCKCTPTQIHAHKHTIKNLNLFTWTNSHAFEQMQYMKHLRIKQWHNLIWSYYGYFLLQAISKDTFVISWLCVVCVSFLFLSLSFSIINISMDQHIALEKGWLICNFWYLLIFLIH